MAELYRATRVVSLHLEHANAIVELLGDCIGVSDGLMRARGTTHRCSPGSSPLRVYMGGQRGHRG